MSLGPGPCCALPCDAGHVILPAGGGVEVAAPLVEPAVKRRSVGSHSPQTQRMQMRLSYAERSPQGGLEVELISSPERVPPGKTKSPGKNKNAASDLRVSCRELGEVDHEGWLFKKGNPLPLLNPDPRMLIVRHRGYTLFCPGVISILSQRLLHKVTNSRAVFRTHACHL